MDNIAASEVIELKELRIGNILQYDGKYVHVTNISSDIDDEYEDLIGFCELGKTTNEISDWNRALADKLRRVPLSNEILKSFGFEIKEYFLQLNNLTIKQTYDGFQLIGERYKIGTEIQFFHQLQNLYYSLTGEELKIK